MMRNCLLKYLVCVLCFVACEEDKKSSDITIDLESYIQEKDTKDIVLNDFASIKNITPIETNDSVLLGFVNIAGVTEDYLIINDKENVYYVNKKDGRVFFRLNKLGRGAGEYTQIFDAFFNETDSTIYLFDPNMRNLNLYSWSGDFLRSIHNEFLGGCCVLDNGDFVVCASPYSKAENKINIYDKSWNLLRSGIKREVGQKFDMYHFDQLGKYNGECYYKAAFGDTIFQVSSQSERPFLIFDKGRYKLPMEIAANMKKKKREVYKYIRQDYGRLVENYLFLTYVYDRKVYYDIWNVATTSLLYRNVRDSEIKKSGIPLLVNNIQVNVWPQYVAGNSIYCIVGGEEVLKLFPDLSEDTNPAILELVINE